MLETPTAVFRVRKSPAISPLVPVATVRDSTLMIVPVSVFPLPSVTVIASPRVWMSRLASVGLEVRSMEKLFRVRVMGSREE